MNLNLNVTLSLIIDGKRSDAEHDAVLKRLESSINHFKALYPVSVAISNQSASNGNVEANKAYLVAHGKGKTPKCTDKEIILRQRLPDVAWDNLQARREALLAIGYDVFNVQRDLGDIVSDSDMPSKPFDGEISDEVPD